jgi:signal transduction histidine kinase/CheY-like chemotaxis protein
MGAATSSSDEVARPSPFARFVSSHQQVPAMSDVPQTVAPAAHQGGLFRAVNRTIGCLAVIAVAVSGAAYLLHVGYQRQLRETMDVEMTALGGMAQIVAAASRCREAELDYARHVADPELRKKSFHDWEAACAALESSLAPPGASSLKAMDRHRLARWRSDAARSRRLFLELAGRIEGGAIPDVESALASLDPVADASSRLIRETLHASELAMISSDAAVARLDADISRGKLLALLRGLVPFAVLLLLGGLFSRLVLRRLAVVTATLREIAGGNLAARAPVDGDDELGTVARHLNEMAQTIQENQAHLESAHTAALIASHSKSEFLASMSHEIRTPMTAILGFADELTRSASRQEEVELAGTISRNGQHLLHVINDILDLSKIEAGKLAIQVERVALGELLHEIKRLMRCRMEHRDLTLNFSAPAELPEWIETDPTRLRQILINLIGNAIKFTERGSIHVVTAIDDRDGENPKLRIDVVDTGAGITPAQLARLFRPFSQVDSDPARQAGGTGLGLVICKRLAAALDGEIRVASCVGAGSTFTVVVPTGPLRDVPWINAEHPSSGELMVVEVAGDDLSGRRILVVEDGPDNRRLLARILERAGAQVALVNNGAEALDAVAHRTPTLLRFDLILMDMQMPVLDGYQATRRLRSQGYDRPIVALTANAMQHDRQRCLDAGCDDYLTKPIVRSDLLRLVGGLTTAVGGKREAVAAPPGEIDGL